YPVAGQGTMASRFWPLAVPAPRWKIVPANDRAERPRRRRMLPMSEEISQQDVSPQAVKLDRGNFAEMTHSLPARARMMLSVAMEIPHGSLTVHTPEGQVLELGGNGPGPHAELVLRNWNLPSRAFSGATIG